MSLFDRLFEVDSKLRDLERNVKLNPDSKSHASKLWTERNRLGLTPQHISDRRKRSVDKPLHPSQVKGREFLEHPDFDAGDFGMHRPDKRRRKLIKA